MSDSITIRVSRWTVVGVIAGLLLDFGAGVGVGVLWATLAR